MENDCEREVGGLGSYHEADSNPGPRVYFLGALATASPPDEPF